MKLSGKLQDCYFRLSQEEDRDVRRNDVENINEVYEI